jgi:sterol desaturase/sphingolipid hydroxylase (fatty acid hydroxylase superfamily)
MVLTLHVVLLTIAVAILLERLPATRRRRLRFWRDHAWTDVAFLIVAWVAIARISLAWVTAATGTLHATNRALPLAVEVVASIVLLDLGNYVAHWLLHRSEWLWRFHQVHHSSPALDWLATFRSHVVEQLLRRVVAPLALIAVGMSAPAVGIASALFLGWAIFNHANVAVGLRWMEPVFITPRLHHLHHVTASQQHNLGTVLSVWDRLLGRLDRREVARDAPLGNADPGYPQTFVRLLREPFRGVATP